MKISFLVIIGIVLIVLGFIGFLIPITNSGLTVLEVDELCQKTSDSISPEKNEEPEICKHTKFFNSIYFLFGVGLVLIFWSGFLEKHYRKNPEKN
jgi:hypothetical protein